MVHFIAQVMCSFCVKGIVRFWCIGWAKLIYIYLSLYITKRLPAAYFNLPILYNVMNCFKWLWNLNASSTTYLNEWAHKYCKDILNGIENFYEFNFISFHYIPIGVFCPECQDDIIRPILSFGKLIL